MAASWVLPSGRSSLTVALALALLVHSTLSLAAHIDDDSEEDRPQIFELNYGQFAPTNRLSGASPLRRKLSEARMWLYGNVLTQGYYYANVWFGTPPRRFALIVDTGSTVTYVPCSTCTHCGTHHQDTPFVPHKSSTYEPVGCNADQCPTWECRSESVCSYERHYAENSSSSGLIISDLVGFGNTSAIPPTRVLFGCETGETGDIYSQQADGILGMGRGPLGLVTQLVGAKSMREQFSLCYGGMDTSGGAMIMGAYKAPPGMKFTALSQGQGTYYNVELQSISVAGDPLPLDSSVFRSGYGTVLDSGTTFAYLPPMAFEAFKKAISAGVSGLKPVPGPDEAYDDVCYSGATDDLAELPNFFPTVTLNLGGGVNYELAPENFLFRHTKVKGAYCLALFANADEGTLLGGIITRNTLVTYDRARSRIGLWKTDCLHLFHVLHGLQGGNKAPLPKELEEQPPPLKDTAGDAAAAGNSNAPGGISAATDDCVSCARSLRVELRVSLPLLSFAPLIPDFVHDMAASMKLEEVQLSVDKFSEVRPASPSRPAITSVSLLVLPLPPDDVLAAATVERLERLLKSPLRAHEVFGHVTVGAVTVNRPIPHYNLLSLHRSHWSAASAVVLALILIAIIAGAAVVAGSAWRRDAQKRYGSLGHAPDAADEEQGLAPARAREEAEDERQGGQVEKVELVENSQPQIEEGRGGNE